MNDSEHRLELLKVVAQFMDGLTVFCELAPRADKIADDLYKKVRAEIAKAEGS